MGGTTVTGTGVAELLAELAGLEDPRAREVNERHGDDHGVNLSKLRAIAKRVKTQQELAGDLWATGDTAARLLALLVCRPKAFGRGELDAMLREARAPKVQDWLVNYVVKKNPHAEGLRVAWLGDPDPVVASAGWALTSERVVKAPDGLDLEGLLDVIEAEMKDAPDRLQWAMNTCLAQIGIEHAGQRDPGPGDRRAPAGAQGLPHVPGLHLTVRAHVDQRDGAPAGRSVGAVTGSRPSTPWPPPGVWFGRLSRRRPAPCHAGARAGPDGTVRWCRGRRC